MPHLGALGFNREKLIDTHILVNADDVYVFMTKALQVKEFIKASHMQPSPNALICQVMDQFSRSNDHYMAISAIKQDFVLFVCQHTSTKLYLANNPMTIQLHLIAVTLHTML